MNLTERELSWTTLDEMKVIDYIASEKPRIKDVDKKEGKKLTIQQRKARLKGYIQSCYKREWGAMDAFKCEQYAQFKLASI